MLITRTPHGLYPYAGIPWYSTPFGRDGIITAMLSLWVDPAIARGVLALSQRDAGDARRPRRRRAAGQDFARDPQWRDGAARRSAVPALLRHGRCDAALCHARGHVFRAHRRLETIKAIWPNIKAALRWIDEYGDADGDGFVEYARAADNGLANQGWKDSV